jgi:5-methylcytosine-specific restriction endonuclease McrA
LGKICIHCEIQKPLTDFHKKKKSVDGVREECKECRKAESFQYYHSNKEIMIKKSVEYYYQHKQDIEFMEKMRKRSREYMRNKRIANPEYDASWRQANKEYTKGYGKRWRAANPDKNARKEAYRRARKKGQTPELSPFDLLLINAIYTLSKLCSNTFKESYEVDHIIPIIKGGLHHPDNLQVITATENRRKSSKIL